MEQNGSSTHYHIESEQAILGHDQFNIAQNESVDFHFHNPTAASSVLNRVTGGELSTLAGTLISNGQVYLINPAGIHITSTGVIDTAGFVASTLNITNENFLAKNLIFEQDPNFAPAAVVNQGTILVRPGDLLALLGGAVKNEGLLVAELGTITMVSGPKITLTFDQDGWLAVAVDQPLDQLAVGPDGRPVTSAIENTGSIFAPGGQILVQARAVEGLFNRLINLPSGVIEAVTVVDRGGWIELVGEGGTLYNGGAVRADGTAEAPNGGEVSVHADRIEQAGLVSANAAEGGEAGDVTLTGKDSVALKDGSRTEAKASGADGKGGSVRVVSEQPKQSGSVALEQGALIDVSGGSASGDAGSVELSAAEVEFSGKARAQAQDGYTGGRLLVDPLFLIFNTSAQAAPGNNGSGTPDIGQGDAPADGTTTVEIADIVGFAEAFFQAVMDITVNAPLVMENNNDLRMEAGRDILLNSTVQVKGNGGVMTLIADADFSGGDEGGEVEAADAGLVSDGVGTIVQGAGAQILSDKGTLTLSTGGDFIAGAVKGSGEVRITSTAGSIIDDFDPSTLIEAEDLFLTANSAGQGVFLGGLFFPGVDLDGDLTLDVDAGAFVYDGGSSFTLASTTVGAGGSLVILADQTLNVEGAHSVTGDGAIVLAADFDGDGTGALKMDTGSSLSSDTGDITLSNSGEMELSTITSASGDISASADDNLHVLKNSAISTGGTGTITLIADSDSSGNGHIKMNSGSSLTTDAGDITLRGSDNSELREITSAGGDIDVRSVDGLDLRSPIMTGGAGSIFLDADTNLDGKGDLNMTSGSSLATVDGDIELRAGDDMNLREVTSATGDVCAHSAKDINVRRDITTGGDGMVTLWADSDGDGKGTVTMDSGTAVTTEDGQILLWGAEKTKIRDLTSTSGDIFVWVTNDDADLVLDGLISTGGSVELFAGADIKDENDGPGSLVNPNVIAGGDAEFISWNGRIGSQNNALEVLIGGALDMAAGGAENGVSINVDGMAGGGFGGLPPTPPHLLTVPSIVASLGLTAAGPASPGDILINGTVTALGGPLGSGFDADTVCITGVIPPVPPPPGGGPGGGTPPPSVTTASADGDGLDFLFEVENRRRYRGFVI